MKTKNNIVAFSSKETDLQFLDYWNHYLAKNSNLEKDKNREYWKVDEKGNPISFAQKEENMNAALLKEVIRKSGVVDAAERPLEEWFYRRSVIEETFAIVSSLVDMVLPQSIIDSIGLYTDVRNIPWGDSAAFNIEPRDLFIVSKSGNAQRSTPIHKQFKSQVTIIPEFHELTVSVSLYQVLSGQESLAAFVAKVAKSMETQVTVDAYNAFATAMAAVTNTATTGLRVSGYSQDSLVRLCEQVTTWNGGQKAVIAGTQRALVNVLPTDANYRYSLDDKYTTMGYIPTAFGYDVMRIPQVVDISTPFGLTISNSYIWIVSPSAQKILKLVLEGNTLSNTTSPFQNANLTQETTITKSWGVGVATNAVAGVITL